MTAAPARPRPRISTAAGASPAEAVAFALLAAVGGTLVAAQLSWLLDTFTPVLALACGAAGTVAAARWFVHGGRRWIGTVAAAVATVAVAVALASLVRDYSYDGQQYHLQAIAALSSGWNPLRAPPFDGLHQLWINGYPKGPWTWAAVLQGVTGTMEAGKSLNLLLAVAAGASAFDVLRADLGARRGLAAWVAALAAANPVWASQWATNQNDGIIASLLLVVLTRLLAATARLRRQEPDAAARAMRALASAALALALLVDVKLSGIAYALMLWAFGVFVLLVAADRRSTWRWSLACGAGIVAGLFVLGWNPYVTNLLRHGHPLYPLAGVGKADIMTGNRPNGVAAIPAPARLWASIFSESHSELGSPQPDAFRPKLPGRMYLRELKLFVAKTDMRIGGFGPWFSLGLVLSVAALAAAAFAGLRGPTLGAAVLIPAGSLAMAAVFPEAWWARYVPQFWLVPVGLAAGCLVAGTAVAARRLALASLAVLTVNAALVAGLFALGLLVRELDSRTQLESLAQISSRVGPLAVEWNGEPALAQRLRQAGVQTRPAAAGEACERPVVLHQASVRLCVPDAAFGDYRDASPAAKRLVDRLKSGA